MAVPTVDGEVGYLREHFLAYRSMPPVSQICRTHNMDKEAIHKLFGSCRLAWRTAGLPNPGPEALEQAGQEADPDNLAGGHHAII